MSTVNNSQTNNFANPVSDNSNAKNNIDLVQLLLKNVNVPSYKLTPDQIKWIGDFLNTVPAGAFDQIISDINTILKDGEINIKDIPSIIKMFADLVLSILTNANIISTPAYIVTFVEFIFYVLIDSNLIKLSDAEKNNINDFLKTILNLLITNLNVVTQAEEDCVKSKCWVSFSSIFTNCKCSK